MAQELNETQLRSLIRQMLEEGKKPQATKKIVKEQEDKPKAEGPQSWFTIVNITRILQTRLGRELANNKDIRSELSGILSELIKKRYAYPEVQALMSFIEKYK